MSGVAVSGAHLFLSRPADGSAAVRERFEEWIVQHARDLEFSIGLSRQALQIEPADNFEVKQGDLTLYRFRQFYRASSILPRVPIVGDGALVTLELDRRGAIAIGGTIVDPRTPYLHTSIQAPLSRAKASIKHHASLRTGIPEAKIDVDALQLVAIPWAKRLAWYGVATAGKMFIGRLIVDADPTVPDLLGLFLFDDGTAYALHNETPITVRTQQWEEVEDPWAVPIPYVANTLSGGSQLLGSIFDGNAQAQLATEQVVVLDMQGKEFNLDLYDLNTNTWLFERYTAVAGQFLAAEPEEEFRAQRLYHLVGSGYSIVNRVALGKWDSAMSWKSPTLNTAFAPGTYLPRIFVGYDHASTGSAGKAGVFNISADPEVISGFPEAIQWPAPGLPNEPLATIEVPPGLLNAGTLFHEAGHSFDFFLAPAYPHTDVPRTCAACTGCEEDTSDEALPLTETIAQMFAMWQVMRVFPEMPHDSCGLMINLGVNATGEQKVHSPGCMGPNEQLNVFRRNDDPLCEDDDLCDKPSGLETDELVGAPHWCDATEGYNVFSLLQLWWNLLHGLYCAPPGPMGVTCVPQVPNWPPGCVGNACEGPDEIAGAAFLYAVRSNPKSYRQFLDAMGRYMACNYGPGAYVDAFNQALCDHRLIDECDDEGRPTVLPPVSCGECGNGIREGAEKCDGDDVSNPGEGFGKVWTCEDFGFEGGVLECQGILGADPCNFDHSQCISPDLDDTAGTTADAAGLTTDVSSDGVSGMMNESADADSGGEGGNGSRGGSNGLGNEDCNCTSGKPGGMRMTLFSFFVGYSLIGRRRRGGRVPWRRLASLLLLSFGAVSCAECPNASEGPIILASSSASGSTSSDPVFTTGVSHSGGVSETGSVPEGWPQSWYGDYYEDPGPDVALGQEYQGVYINPHGFRNVQLGADSVTIVRFLQDEGAEQSEWIFLTEIDGGMIRVLPPGETWDVLFPGADEVFLRPGVGCDELVLEIHAREPPYAPFWSVRLWRGRLCVMDSYDDSIANDKWMIDLCPGSVDECEG